MKADPRTIRKKALELIAAQTTMTLATAAAGSAWAAPVYYVCHKRRFYFFSKPTSRHIQESAAGTSGAAIFAAAAAWEDIRGIQMSGTVTPLSAGLESFAAIGAYLKKYPFTRDFFRPGENPDLAAFADRFSVRLYRFTPAAVFYSDNRIRFGFREAVDL